MSQKSPEENSAQVEEFSADLHMKYSKIFQLQSLGKVLKIEVTKYFCLNDNIKKIGWKTSEFVTQGIYKCLLL